MTLQERLTNYQGQHKEWVENLRLAGENVNRLAGAIASVEDQLKEEAEAAANKVGEAANVVEGEHIAPGD